MYNFGVRSEISPPDRILSSITPSVACMTNIRHGVTISGRNESGAVRVCLLGGSSGEGRHGLGNITELMSCSRRGAHTTTWPILEIAPTDPKEVLNSA